MRHYNTFILALFALSFLSCNDNTSDTPAQVVLNLPAHPYDYSFDFPQHFMDDPVAQDINNGGSLTENPRISDAGATLGRVLFYDTKLSLNNAVACASCHHQSKAFADGLASSTGFEGRKTTRNSMAIINPVLNDNLFWDSRATSVTDLTLKPVQNHIEMGMEDLEYLATKLSSTTYYGNLFQDAYGSSVITADRISEALAQFLCSMVTHNSRFDAGSSTGFQNFTPLEKHGRELFFSNRAQCSSCHAGPNFSAQEFSGPYVETSGTANIGLDIVYDDNGLGGGKFRIPSLRNIAVTAPYMHDGRFTTLEEVVEHYDKGIQPHAELDIKFRGGDGQPKKLNLTPIEKEALIAFLHTLTDEQFMRDDRWSDPFER